LAIVVAILWAVLKEWALFGTSSYRLQYCSVAFLSLRWLIVKKVLRYCSTIELQAFKSVKVHLLVVVSANSIESA
jgi:hypothetical protein